MHSVTGNQPMLEALFIGVFDEGEFKEEIDQVTFFHKALASCAAKP
ncbi:hypothetical protein LG277_00195 [Vreelandella aquamarina]